MSNYLDALGLVLAADTERGAHRRAAYRAAPWSPTPTTRVSYSAANRVLIVADSDTASAIRARLPSKLLCYVAIPYSESVAIEEQMRRCTGLEIRGYLGCFSATADNDNNDDNNNRIDLARAFEIQSGLFDQVIDCSATPLITAAVKPPGYHHAADAQALDAAVAAVPEMIGEFEKPKYFRYNADICAHGRSGIRGCTRCLDACPTDAIRSLGDAIEAAAHLCQGGGGCAGGCPTGAIEYVYPPSGEIIEFVRVLLRELRARNGASGATLLIYDDERGADAVRAAAPRLDDSTLPLAVEEIGSVGLDLIAAALAYGANRVRLFAPAATPAQSMATIEFNAEIANAVIAHIGCDDYSVEIIRDADALARTDSAPTIERAATFAAVGDKRDTIRAAFSFLHSLCATDADVDAVCALPDGASFGDLRVDDDACTLCMACVSVCPASALQAGGDTPALRLIEGNCVQCGICASACPERALTLQPQLRFDADALRAARTLKQEAAFHCIRCNKPFATEAIIARMTEKLQSHWMFENPEALRRLRMCEDCRVTDLFEKEGRG